ncbi:hypothetical protein [Streptomyces sp. NPDC005009]
MFRFVSLGLLRAMEKPLPEKWTAPTLPLRVTWVRGVRLAPWKVVFAWARGAQAGLSRATSSLDLARTKSVEGSVTS